MSDALMSSVELRLEVEAFYADYAVTMDRKLPNEWVDMFIEEGLYAVTTHENKNTTGMWWYTDRGLYARKERAAFTNGYFWHSPQKMLHTISNVRVQTDGSDDIRAQAYFVLYVADRDQMSQLHVCGEFDDKFTRENSALRFVEHRVVIDSETVPPNMGVLL